MPERLDLKAIRARYSKVAAKVEACGPSKECSTCTSLAHIPPLCLEVERLEELVGRGVELLGKCDERLRTEHEDSIHSSKVLDFAIEAKQEVPRG